MTDRHELLPTVRFGPHRVTRLIVGGNPIRGFSHVGRALDADMREYHTVDNTVETWLHCQRQGINTMQSRGDPIIFERIRAYRERGGTMQWICQTAGEAPDPFENVREIAALEPMAIYYHGSMGDKHWRAGTFDQVREVLKAIRDTGALVGIAGHQPKILRYVEEHGWDVDFYMTSFYNIAKVNRRGLLAEGVQGEEPFDDPDREIMAEFIRATNRPCIAYKILAASRKCESHEAIREAFRFAFEHVKPGDVVNVGMFQKYSDQVRQNAEIVRDLLGAATTAGAD